jgi:hypothetical protein
MMMMMTMMTMITLHNNQPDNEKTRMMTRTRIMTRMRMMTSTTPIPHWIGRQWKWQRRWRIRQW